MLYLKRGSSGAFVVTLQTKLLNSGFNPGKIDGNFGGGTEAAVIAFQKSEDLLPDGIVGIETIAKLKLSNTPQEVIEPNTTSFKNKFSVEIVSKLFPTTPISNIRKNLPFVLDSLADLKLDDKDMILMALATIRAETEGFEPISEFRSRWNSSPRGHSFDLYDNRSDLGNKGKPDGASFKGRGFIQLTGRANYTFYSLKLRLGNQLIESPDLANNPSVAAKLIAYFLKDKEKLIRQAILEKNLKQARKLVNGGSHGYSIFKNTFKTGNKLI